MHILLASGLILGVGLPVHAQAGAGGRATITQAADVPAQLTFEVATVKPIDPNAPPTTGLKIYPGARVVIPSASLKGLVTTAFGLSYWQVSTREAWMEDEEYDVVGKPPETLRSRIKNLHHTLFGIEDETLRAMLQALLIDRFQLKFHRETKIGDVHLIERSAKPLALTPAEDVLEPGSPSEGEGVSGSIGRAGGRWVLANTSMRQLAKFASDYVLHTPVLDKTELSGLFDYKQPPQLIDSEANDTDHNASFMRLISQLGLKLEKTKGPIETLMIDRAVRPSGN